MLRNTSKRLLPFIKRNHVSAWNWVQLLLHPTKLYLKRTRVVAFIIDKTMLQIGSDYGYG
jgi:hypothetical protein